MLVHHLRHRIPKQHYVLIERLDLSLQLDAVHQVNGDGHIFLPEKVEVRILQKKRHLHLLKLLVVEGAQTECLC